MVSGTPGWLRPIIGPVRRYFDVNVPCRGQIRFYVDAILTFLLLIAGSSSFTYSSQSSWGQEVRSYILDALWQGSGGTYVLRSVMVRLSTWPPPK